MKYFAILKDSLREAIDTKVFYAMLVLSLLLVLFVASIGFRPVEGAEAINAIVQSNDFRMVSPERGKSASVVAKQFLPAQFQVSNIKQLTDATSPSARDYSFTLTATEGSPFALDGAIDFWSKPTPEEGQRRDAERTAAKIVSDDQLREFIKEHFATVADLTVETVGLKVLNYPSINAKDGSVPGKYEFEIQTKGRAGTKGWPNDISLFFGLIDPQSGIFRGTAGSWVFLIENTLVNNIGGWVALLVGIVITALFIPNMLRKGTIDMLLAKPIHRPVLLIYKYIGGLTFMFLSSCAAIGGVWLVLGLRSGIWSPGFFLTIFTLTFFFAILYSVSALFGVLTRSPIVSILVTCFTWFVLWLVGQMYSALNVVWKDPALHGIKEEIPGWAFKVTDVVHFLLPRTSDISVLNVHLVGSVLTDNERRLRGFLVLPDVSWTESVAASLAFIAVMLGLACWRFSRKDF